MTKHTMNQGWGGVRRFAFGGWIAVFVGLFLTASVASLFARAADDQDEYSFQWLDPDKKIYVLQNRRYTKANRPMITVMGGSGFSNPYRNVYSIDGRLAYYFSEAFGIEGFYSHHFNSPNNTYTALQAAAADTLPVTREIKAFYGGLLHWVPWYAKINMFNSILYFDWYLSGGAGMMQSQIDVNRRVSRPPSYIQQDKLALFLGTGHQYHLNEHWTARLDFQGSYYAVPLYGQTGENTWFSDYTISLGIAFRP